MRVLFYLFCVKGARRERYSPFSWRICFSASSARRSACFLASSTNFVLAAFAAILATGFDAFSTNFSPSLSAASTSFCPASSAFFLILATCSSVVPLPARASFGKGPAYIGVDDTYIVADAFLITQVDDSQIIDALIEPGST